jgi:hypothetical protein
MSLVDHLVNQPSLDISPIWTSIIAVECRKFNNSIQCRLCMKILFLCWYHTENLSL